MSKLSHFENGGRYGYRLGDLFVFKQAIGISFVFLNKKTMYRYPLHVYLSISVVDQTVLKQNTANSRFGILENLLRLNFQRFCSDATHSR